MNTYELERVIGDYVKRKSIISRFCGHYCACFCVLRSRGIDMCRFLRYFTQDTGLNDVVVHELMCSLM